MEFVLKWIFEIILPIIIVIILFVVIMKMIASSEEKKNELDVVEQKSLIDVKSDVGASI